MLPGLDVHRPQLDPDERAAIIAAGGDMYTDQRPHLMGVGDIIQNHKLMSPEKRMLLEEILGGNAVLPFAEKELTRVLELAEPLVRIETGVLVAKHADLARIIQTKEALLGERIAFPTTTVLQILNRVIDPDPNRRMVGYRTTPTGNTVVSTIDNLVDQMRQGEHNPGHFKELMDSDSIKTWKKMIRTLSKPALEILLLAQDDDQSVELTQNEMADHFVGNTNLMIGLGRGDLALQM